MSQLFVRLGRKFVQLGLLILLSLCVGHPGAAICQSGGPGASADPAEQATAIPDTGKQTTVRDASGNRSKNGSFILTEVEPLLLLLFGSLLFFVATCIKLRLSRGARASSQYFEPLVSRPSSRSETRS